MASSLNPLSLSLSVSVSVLKKTADSWPRGKFPAALTFPLLIRTRLRRKRASVARSSQIPDYLPTQWIKTKESKPVGPGLNLTAEEAVLCQLEALKNNDQPHEDHGIEVMYRFAGFDPFQRSKYFGRLFDLGQFERFRRLFHHSTYRIMLGHNDAKILSSLYVDEHCFKQRVWVQGSRPDEAETFEFTLIQRVGGCWDGYWLTDSVCHDGEGIKGSIAY